MIDLRSDTLTKPSAGMLAAMQSATLGDDVYREDGDVLLLERKLAELFGKARALFLPSGTMANQIAIHLHTRAGDEVLVPAGAHVANFEVGAGAALSGVSFREMGQHGCFDDAELVAQLQPRSHMRQRVGLLIAENTHNRAGGLAISHTVTQRWFALAKAASVPTHLDGARLWNAHAAWSPDAELDSFTVDADSVSVCLSKGLGAPVGSVLLGGDAFIEEALRVRKRWGGAMRQSGLLARAALYALQHQRDLRADHVRAQYLVSLLHELPNDFAIEEPPAGSRRTNMVILRCPDAAAFEKACRVQGILLHSWSSTSVRIVFHRDVTDAEVEVCATRLLGVMQRSAV